ncbi:MAG: AAA family ATPase, partial [Thermoleophilia bacterium]|nr:AAA family ATPase [Thermoleophilia bacterium]
RKHPHQEFLTIDTSNVLFICGGAFAGLDKIIERRIGKQSLGFGKDLDEDKVDLKDIANVFAEVMPEDLNKFGLIPEFVGRLPVISAVHPLKADDLVRVLTEPKNALVKQYKKFFAYDDVELVFTEDALTAVAEAAISRETGARGLRSIIENALLDVMFELPGREDVTKCVVTRDTIERGTPPTLLTEGGSAKDDAEEDAASA